MEDFHASTVTSGTSDSRVETERERKKRLCVHEHVHADTIVNSNWLKESTGFNKVK